jgi:hypothetical protein
MVARWNVSPFGMLWPAMDAAFGPDNRLQHDIAGDQDGHTDRDQNGAPAPATIGLAHRRHGHAPDNRHRRASGEEQRRDAEEGSLGSSEAMRREISRPPVAPTRHDLAQRLSYSSWRRHHSYGGVCGYPSGESSHVSCRPSGVRSRRVQTLPSASTPRPEVK